MLTLKAHPVSPFSLFCFTWSHTFCLYLKSCCNYTSFFAQPSPFIIPSVLPKPVIHSLLSFSLCIYSFSFSIWSAEHKQSFLSHVHYISTMLCDSLFHHSSVIYQRTESTSTFLVQCSLQRETIAFYNMKG